MMVAFRQEGTTVGRTLVWVAVGVVVLLLLGTLVVKVVAALMKLALSALILVILVGGALYLIGRARGGLRGPRGPRRIGR